MKWIKHFVFPKFVHKLKNPRATQEQLLLKILETNKSTIFGTQFQFSKITSLADYKEIVPIHHYDDLRNYIRKQDETKKSYLTTENPVLYAQTSGTTNKPKYIPVLKSSIRQFKQSQKLSACIQYSAYKDMFEEKIFAMVSPKEEGVLNTNTHYGSMSGIIYSSMPKLLRSKYVLPAAVFEIKDHVRKYKTMATYAIENSDISTLATANPSSIITLINTINDINGSKTPVTFKHIWPNLKAVVCWTKGSCQFSIPKLKTLVPVNCKIIEMGYLSSEFRGSITVDIETNAQVPTIHENIFEFVEKNKWEQGCTNTVFIDEVEEGLQYYVIVTTKSGLYRYFIDDIVEVSHKFQETPTISFVQKGKGTTNITGEKLTENQVIQAIKHANNTHNLSIDSFVMLADLENSFYSLFIELEPPKKVNLNQEIDNFLCNQNIEYKAKRNSLRLNPLQVHYLNKKAFREYKNYCVKKGQRESQFKYIKLQMKNDCHFDFNSSKYLYDAN